MKDLIFNVTEGSACLRPGDDGGQYIVAFEGPGKDATMIVLKLTEGTWESFKHQVKSEIENPIRPKDCQWEPINAEFRRCTVHGGTALKGEFDRDTWGHVPTVRCHVPSNALTESEATAKAFYEDKSFVNIEAIARRMAAQLNVNQILVSQALKDALLGEYGQECT